MLLFINTLTFYLSLTPAQYHKRPSMNESFHFMKTSERQRDEQKLY